MSFNDAPTDREAEARALLLGGHEGIEDLLEKAVRDSGTGILDLQHDPLFTVSLELTQRDRQSASVRHRLDRVEQDIEQQLFQLASITIDDGGLRIVASLHADLRLLELPSQESESLLDQLSEKEGDDLLRLRTGEVPQTSQKFADAFNFLHNDLGELVTKVLVTEPIR